MKNSDPGLSVVFTQRPDSNLDSVFTIQATRRNFQYGPNFGVSVDPSSSVVLIHHSHGRVYSRQTFA